MQYLILLLSQCSLRMPSLLRSLREHELSCGLPQAAHADLKACVEDETLQDCHAQYLDWAPTQRSTIALAFSSDARLLASSQ